MRFPTTRRRGRRPGVPAPSRLRCALRRGGREILRGGAVLLVAVRAATLGAGGPAPIVDLRAAALLMSGQEGGELRPDVALVPAAHRRTALVSVRLAEAPDAIGDPAEASPGPPGVEVILYSVGPGNEVVDRAGWRVRAGETGRLLAAEVRTRPGGEVRLLVRSGERLGLARGPVPPPEKGSFRWRIEEGEEILWAPDREAPADPTIAEPRPRLVPGGERHAVACVGETSPPGELSVELETRTEASPLPLRIPDGASVTDGCLPVVVVIPSGLRAPDAVLVVRREGAVLDRRRPGGPVDETPAPEAPVVASGEEEIELDTLRTEWRRELLRVIDAKGPPDGLVRLEARIVGLFGPEALRGLPDPWLAELSPDGLLGLATLRLELAGLHAVRPGGYAAAVQGIEGAGELADLVAARGRAADAAALRDLVALQWLERGARRRVREQLAKAVELEDAASRRIALGVLAEKGGRRSAAIAHFERALEIESLHPEARLRLGIQLARSGERTRAREILRELRSGGAGVPRWIGILALEEWVRLEADEDPETALHWLRRAVEARPEHPTLRLQLASLLDRVGERTAAAEHLDRLVQLRPAEGPGSERVAYNHRPTAVLETSLQAFRRSRSDRLRALREAWGSPG